MAQALYPGLHNYKQGTINKHLELPAYEAHRACEDSAADGVQLFLQALLHDLRQRVARVPLGVFPGRIPELLFCTLDAGRVGAARDGADVAVDAGRYLARIGHAVWVAQNCIVNTDGVSCGNCARHCPTGAILMEWTGKKGCVSALIRAM